MSIRFIFAWYDLWVGAYWDRANRRLYVLPLPMVGIVIWFPRNLGECIDADERRRAQEKPR